MKSEEPHWKHKPGLHRRGKWLSVFLSSLIHVNAVMTELVVWTLMEPVRVCVCVAGQPEGLGECNGAAVGVPREGHLL